MQAILLAHQAGTPLLTLCIQAETACFYALQADILKTQSIYEQSTWEPLLDGLLSTSMLLSLDLADVRLQVSMLQGNNQQLMDELHAARTAAAIAAQKAALLERQLQDALEKLQMSAGAEISSGLRLSAVRADLDETRRELRETQVSCSDIGKM